MIADFSTYASQKLRNHVKTIMANILTNQLWYTLQIKPLRRTTISCWKHLALKIVFTIFCNFLLVYVDKSVIYPRYTNF